ncbi:hypothetical protein EYZ11_010819 [Aspergillus tanneri]|uniref:Uncharacterized protein n=1 Tax=Aspergillus tanneri TaxID=1220188 RepID=A0A4S3J4E3_9EURO|nr:hypothetical protein EYZ11_010819 [Aspergillus tanneri]
MLESHHSLVVKALQKLYKLCLNKEGFPGEPLVEAPDGHPLTHAILDRLGLIKQAEENPEEPDEDTEELQYLRFLSTSTDCSATTDPSPEPTTPPEPSSSNYSPTKLSPKVGDAWKWDFQHVHPVNHPGQYSSYPSFHGMPMPRPTVMPIGPRAEPKCADAIHPGLDSEHPYFYYTGSNCHGESKGRLHSDVATEPGRQQIAAAANMPVGILGDYNLHVQEQHQTLYSSLEPNWHFPYTYLYQIRA